MYAYCLQCQWQHTALVVWLLRQRPEVECAFSPQVLQRQRRQGKMEQRYMPLLPGYVFLFTPQPLDNAFALARLPGVLRCLQYHDGEDLALRGEDLAFALGLYRAGGTVNAITAIKAGDTVNVTDPLLKDYQGQIEQVDFRKQRARVRFRFNGVDRHIWLACNVIYKDPVHKQHEQQPNTAAP